MLLLDMHVNDDELYMLKSENKTILFCIFSIPRQQEVVTPVTVCGNVILLRLNIFFFFLKGTSHAIIVFSASTDINITKRSDSHRYYVYCLDKSEQL